MSKRTPSQILARQVKKIASPRPNQPSVIIARIILDPRARFRGATREHVRSGEEAGGARPLRRRDPRRAARLRATARAIRPRAPPPPDGPEPPPPLLSRTSSFQGEAAKKGGLLNTLLKVAPWKITGPASGPGGRRSPSARTSTESSPRRTSPDRTPRRESSHETGSPVGRTNAAIEQTGDRQSRLGSTTRLDRFFPPPSTPPSSPLTPPTPPPPSPSPPPSVPNPPR